MALSIEIVSDVVCPWCFIGTTRLEAALAARPDLDATITFRPFLLDPSTPPEGGDLRSRLRAKYGMDPERMFARVEGVAHEAGIPLDFSKVRRFANTVPAHTLLRRTEGTPAQVPLAKALFVAYFIDGRDVGNVDVLVDVARMQGLDPEVARAWLGSPEELDLTRREARAQAERGINGVPFFVFADRFAISGAQPLAVFAKALELATNEPGT